MKRFVCIITVLLNFILNINGQDIHKIDSLKHVIRVTEDDNVKINTLMRLSYAYIYYNANESLIYAQEAYGLSKESEDKVNIMETAVLLSEINAKTSDFELSIKYANEAYTIAEAENNQFKLAQVMVTLANVYLSLYDLEKSMELFYSSLKICEEINSKRGMLAALNGIGIIYHEQDNYDKAIEYFNRCYELNKEIGDENSFAAAINNLASVYSKSGQYDKSIRYYLEAIESVKETDNRYWECVSYSNLGDSYHRIGANDLAFKYFNMSNALALELKDYELITSASLNFAKYYLERKLLDSCIYYAHKSYLLAVEYNFISYSLEASNIIQKCYNQQGEYKNAYDYAIIHSNIKDSLKIEQSVEKLANLELHYKIEKEEQIRQMEQQRKRWIQIILIVIFVAIFVVILIVLLARHRVTVKKMTLDKIKVENELDLRNKELALNVMTLLKKNDMLTTISKELYDVKKEAVRPETKEAINRISKKIRQSSESDIWKEFELRFKEVHSDFYETLTKKYPELSPGEHRLCALLRLNMSSKEIAELTGQSLNALDKARYRLRKKLNLSNSQVNLVTFLSSL